MEDNSNGFSEEYNEYTMGLALVDLMPVLMFLMSGLIMWNMYGSPLLLAGVLACFTGGLCKAVWKIIVVKAKKDISGLTRAFHILMPAGFVLMILSVPAGGKAAFSGLWKAVTMMPASVLFAASFLLMCLMGYLGSHMDSSARSNWIEELVNTLAQLAFLAGVIVVYFGTYYHADAAALEALEPAKDVAVSEITQEYDGADGWFFDGPGADSAMVFYPGAKVEAAAYAPLLRDISAGGTDCYLCRMPLNFALLGRSAAEKIRAGNTDGYEKWYVGGHSLGGVAAAMAADDAEEAGSGSEWDGLILLASYPTKELSTPVISIYGSEDRVLDSDKYSSTEKEGLWPDDFTEMIIEGGNHAQFGSYGEQKGDGKSKTAASEQQHETAEAVNNWIKRK